MVDAVIDSIPHLVFLVVLFFITRYELKLARGVFTAINSGRLKIKGFEADWAWPTYRIVRVGIVIFSLVIAYPYIPGSNSAAFQGVSILLGVLFSLGSTSVISNVIAGYTMYSIQAHEVVVCNSCMGTRSDMRTVPQRFCHSVPLAVGHNIWDLFLFDTQFPSVVLCFYPKQNS